MVTSSYASIVSIIGFIFIFSGRLVDEYVKIEGKGSSNVKADSTFGEYRYTQNN